MCLIIDNPSGLRIDPALITNAAKGNADGWGFMSSHKGKIVVLRGMTTEGLDTAVKAHEGMAHAIHFRYATHGTRSLENCHPFVVLNGKYAVMHNGILAVPRHDADRSDTWHFCHHVLAPMLKADPQLFGSPYLTALLESLIGAGNKLVIMRNDGEAVIVNRKAGCDHEGLWLSNSYSLPTSDRYARLGTIVGRWDDETEEEGLQEIEEETHASRPRTYSDFPASLTELADVDYGDLVDFVADHPESAAELIRDFFDYEFS